MKSEYYNNFFRQFNPAGYHEYLRILQLNAGKKYKFASTPVFIPNTQFERLKCVTETVIKLLQDVSYQNSIYEEPWFLPKFPMQKKDYFGCVDFHIQPEAEKIIEINIHTPGFSGFMELIETNFIKKFGCFGKNISQGFENKFITAITNDYYYKKIAVVDIDAYNQYNIDEFRYIQKILARYNVASRVIPSEEVEISETGNLSFEGKDYNRIYNRMIPFDWQLHADKLKNYSELYKTKPRMFFTNPFGWKLGDKKILPVLSNLENQPFNLSIKDVELLRTAALKTKLLKEFSSFDDCVEEFGLPRRVIVKPLDNYAGRGLLFKPSNKKLTEIIEKKKEKYIIQEIFPPGKLPYIMPDRRMTEAKFDVRIVFLNAEIVGVYARIYQGRITNFSGDVGGFAPVFVV